MIVKGNVLAIVGNCSLSSPKTQVHMLFTCIPYFLAEAVAAEKE